ncbi:MAG: hypothetical protein U1E05_09215, partial [Patescibacteria group bacterium]|nr:hypothetical protein [Patescibacteria group bacterium]
AETKGQKQRTSHLTESTGAVQMGKRGILGKPPLVIVAYRARKVAADGGSRNAIFGERLDRSGPDVYGND